jgi:Holliday junction resolvase RusA-like endonuclease
VDGKPLAEATRPRQLQGSATWDGNVLRITIPGPPMGKPRMTRRDKWAKRDCVARYRDWCDKVRAIVGDTLPAAECVLELNWTAYFEPPKSWPKKKRIAALGTLHRVKPDASNILKGIEDCLWPDGDQALAAGEYEKRWDWHARLEVEIVINSAPGDHRRITRDENRLRDE